MTRKILSTSDGSTMLGYRLPAVGAALGGLPRASLGLMAIAVVGFLVGGAKAESTPAASNAGLSAQSANSSSNPFEGFDQDGTLHVSSFDLPLSSYLSPEGKAAMIKAIKDLPQQMPRPDILAWRKVLDQSIAPVIARAEELYPVSIEPKVIDGVYTETIIPKTGVPPRNQHRVLIQLHGGGFMVTARTGGRTESIPIASLGGFKVVAVDYREFPEAIFPAASEDVAKVYRALLKTYKPQNIGIFGCSAGGVLAAESIVWFQSHNLPRPGAIGVFCAGAGASAEGTGDSSHLGVAASGIVPPPGKAAEDAAAAGYFKGADIMSPEVSPVLHPDVIARFPPTLFVSGTRDFELSPAVFSNEQFVKAGVTTELYVIEGVGHGFETLAPDAPEARETNRVIAAFFDRYLGR